MEAFPISGPESWETSLGGTYTRLTQRKNHQRAIVTTARKLLVSIFYMLKRQETYDPPEVSA
jgi:hypothetical protein